MTNPSLELAEGVAERPDVDYACGCREPVPAGVENDVPISVGDGMERRVKQRVIP